MLVTVSGPPGGGKSTTAARVADRLEFDHISGGDIFRSLAADRGLTLGELNERAETDESIDRELDRRLSQIAHEHDNLVLESRLAGWLAGDQATIRCWLDAPLAVRVERIAGRENENISTIRDRTREREASEAKRYREYYDIDIGDRSIYDLAINTARWNIDTVVEMVVDAIQQYDVEADEGRVTIDPIEIDQ